VYWKANILMHLMGSCGFRIALCTLWFVTSKEARKSFFRKSCSCRVGIPVTSNCGCTT